MKFDDLQLFILAARHGSLTAAGREIGLSPAAASARLTALERDLGTSLMARTTRSLSLTADGTAFLSHAERALVELENGRAGLSASTATPRGLLRATMPGPFGRKHILPFLPEFREKYPEVELERSHDRGWPGTDGLLSRHRTSSSAMASRVGPKSVLVLMLFISRTSEIGDLVKVMSRSACGSATPPKTRAMIDLLKAKYGPTPYWEV